MKNILKQVKNTIKIGVFALLILSAVACEKDNEPNINKTSFQPHSDEGNNLKLTHEDGKIEYINGDSVRGWGSGHLLGDNYFKQLGVGNGENVIGIRINIPKGTPKDSIIGLEIKLDGARLYLQNSVDIPLRPELWIEGNGFDVYENAYGKIKIIETDSYDIIGEVKAGITDKSGKEVKISGFFWKKKAESYGG